MPIDFLLTLLTWLWPLVSIMLALFVFCLPQALRSKKSGAPLESFFSGLCRWLLVLLFFLVGVLPMVTYLLYHAFVRPIGFNIFLARFVAMAQYDWAYPVTAVLGSLFIKLCSQRYLLPALSNLNRHYGIYLSGDRPTDIRDEKIRFSPKVFKPEDYYEKDKISFGLNEQDAPVLIDRDIWRETNLQIIGPTRTGKGVLMGSLINQSILIGDCVIYIDPKGDKFMPSIMAAQAKAQGRDFFYCDLNDSGPGAWHPFLGGTKRARRARLLTAYGLENTGNESDFYKAKERQVIDLLFQQSSKINAMKQMLENKAGGKLQEQAQRLTSELAEWAEIASLSPKGEGLSIEKCLRSNAAVYIKGSLDDKIVRAATRIIIMEIIQEARRLSGDRSAHLSLYIDELRFLTSNALVDALATVTGFQTNVIVAYQSMNDLRNLEDVNLNPLSIEKSVNTNCQLKFIYGAQDPDTCEWATRMSGEQQKLLTTREETAINGFGAEHWQGKRTRAHSEEAYITSNTMLSLKPCVGVLFQPRELAKIVYTHFVAVTAPISFDKQHCIKATEMLPENDKACNETNRPEAPLTLEALL